MRSALHDDKDGNDNKADVVSSPGLTDMIKFLAMWLDLASLVRIGATCHCLAGKDAGRRPIRTILRNGPISAKRKYRGRVPKQNHAISPVEDALRFRARCCDELSAEHEHVFPCVLPTKMFGSWVRFLAWLEHVRQNTRTVCRGVLIFPVLRYIDASRIFTEIVKRVVAAADLRQTQVVWNGSEGTKTGQCKKRSLVSVPTWTIDRLRVAMQHIRALDGRSMREPIGMHSEPGQLQQAWHTDYAPENVSMLREQKVAVPASVMMSLQSHTKLILLDPVMAIDIPCGWAVVFDGDVVHAGGGYSQANTRLHSYLDVCGVVRARNTVYVH